MSTILNFEQPETKKLLTTFDVRFFLKRNIEQENYAQSAIDELYLSFGETLNVLKQTEIENKKQFFLSIEGAVRKMFNGGFLTNFLGLDADMRRCVIIKFREAGHDLAYFQYWQKHQRKEITKNKIWDLIIKTGSILAILLSIFKLIEMFSKY